jgi:hypothetical protein
MLSLLQHSPKKIITAGHTASDNDVSCIPQENTGRFHFNKIGTATKLATKDRSNKV